MLSNIGLLNEFKAEIVNSICYLVNKSPSILINYKILEEIWVGYSSNYAHLIRIFCCLVYTHVNEGKLEPRARKCIFLGYANGVKEYRLWCPNSKFAKFLLSKDVAFKAVCNVKS